MVTRIVRIDATLRKASLAVDYDFNMMGNSLQAMLESNVTIESTPHEHLVANALLHSFLLAVRNLCKFLYSHAYQANDIIAEDFFDDNDTWRNLRPELPLEFEEGKLAKMISRRLLHLTYERAEGTKPTWGAFRIAWELGKAMEVLVERVPPDRLATELTEDAAAFLGIMKRYVDDFGSADDVSTAPLSILWEEEDFWLNPRQADSGSA